MINPRYRHFLVSNGTIFFIRLSTVICWETFLHTFAICLSDFILSSTATPSISNSPVMGIAVFSQENCGFTCDFAITIACMVFGGVPLHSVCSYHLSTHETEAAQDQAIRTNYIKAKINKTREKPNCRMCNQMDKTVLHR